MDINERFLSEIAKYGITAYTIQVKYNVNGAQQKMTNFKKGRIKSIPLEVIEGACIGEPRLDVEYIITGRTSSDELAARLNPIATIIDSLKEQINLKDEKIKELEFKLSKKAL